MNTAKEYRCRQTGKILTAKDIPARAQVTRYLPEKVMRKGKLVQPKLFHISPPKDEEKYDDFLFDLADIDPVYPTERPEYNPVYQTLVKNDPEKIEGKWFQSWGVVRRYQDIEEEREAAIEWVKGLAAKKRDEGITVKGIPVRTDSVGIARVTGASQSKSEKINFTVGGDSWELSKTDVSRIFDAIDNHIQSVYTERARMNEEIKVSPDPFNLDVSALL